MAHLALDYADAEANLTHALALARDCETAYRESSDKVRRQFNQVFFKRLLIDDNYEINGELEEPFGTLLGDEIRQAADLRMESELQRILDEGPREDADVAADPNLVLVGSSHQESEPTPHLVGGLKEKTMVGAGGLEPSTSAV